MAALHLLAAQSTQLPRAVAASSSPSLSPTLSASPSPPPSATPSYAAVVPAPVYPYARDAPHPLLSGSLRRGKWTPEEEMYAAAIIQYFLSGVLPIQYGTTLRGYIAQLLHCDPMRVSKKLIPGSIFVGVRIDPKIGRRSYYPCPADTPDLDEHKQRAEHQLAQLRAQFVESIEREEQQEQAAVHPQRVASAVRTQSPQKRKREAQEPSPEPARYQHHRRASLPSLTQVLRQNRPPVATAPIHGYTAPLPSAPLHYQYGSPMASSKWPPPTQHARYDLSRASPPLHASASPPFRHQGQLPHMGPAMYPSPPQPPY